MNTTAMTTSNPARAQPGPNAARELRPDRANHGVSFEDLLAERGPDGPSGNKTSDAPPTETSSDEKGSGTDQDASRGDTDDEGDEQVTQRSPESGRGDAGSSGSDSSPEGPSAVRIYPDAVILPGTAVAVAARELSHAAQVELAQVSQRELSESGETTARPLRLPDEPVREASSQTTLPKGWRGNGPIGPDRFTPPHENPPNQPTPGPATGSTTPVKTEPADPGSPAPPPGVVHARAPVPPAHPAPPPAAPSQIHGQGKAELLQALTGSAESARGAIAGAERAGSQPTGRESLTNMAKANLSGAGTERTRAMLLGTVQRGLASVLSQGGGRMTMVLRPEQLGEVRIRLDAREGVVNARLSATTEAAARTLESGLDTLRATLESRGVRVESLEIDRSDLADKGRDEQNADRGSHDRADDKNNRTNHAEKQSRDRSEADPGTPTGPENGAMGIWTELGLDAVA